MSALENAADRGTDNVIEALLARHNARMNDFWQPPRGSGYFGIRAVLSTLGHTSFALEELGADENRAPADGGGSWANQIGWGIDSVAQVARLMYAGQIIGAAMVVRGQLERWTENMAFNAGTFRTPREDASSFIQRIWSLAERPGEAMRRSQYGERFGASMIPWSGTRAGTVFQELSDLLHGRGDLGGVATWDAADLNGAGSDKDEPDTIIRAKRLITEAAALVARRLRVCATTLAQEHGNLTLQNSINFLPDALPAGGSRPPAIALWPLMPGIGLSDPITRELAFADAIYRSLRKGARPAGRLYRDDETLDLLFISIRHRAAQGALDALKAEKETLGHDLDLEIIRDREMLYILTSESAGLLARWHTADPIRNAAAIAGTCTRTAYWLWLEDDDRAMAMLRVVLEQITRMRTWRIKPTIAARLEASKETTPRDWLRESGLRRISALNRALGEMAHFRISGSWDGARKLLAKLQPADTPYVRSEQTARGWTLDEIAFLLLSETAASMGSVSITIADSMRQILEIFIGSSKEAERRFETLAQRAWSFRTTPIENTSPGSPALDKANLRRLFGESEPPTNST